MERLVTPEAVALDLPVASPASRGLGKLLDVVLQLVTVVLILVGAETAALGEVATQVVVLLSVFLVRLVYPVALETRFGATLGQRAVGLRIVTDDGASIRARQALVRAAVALFEIELTVGTLAFLTAAVRRDGKRLGDLAAGTLAVSVRVGTREAAVLGVTCPPQLQGWARTLDVSGLTPAHRGVLRRFHESSARLPAARRGELATDLADRLLTVLAMPRPPGAGPVEVLRAIQWAAGDRDQRPGPGTAASTAATPTPARPVGPPPPPAPPPTERHEPARPTRGPDDAGFAPPS